MQDSGESKTFYLLMDIYGGFRWQSAKVSDLDRTLQRIRINE